MMIREREKRERERRVNTETRFSRTMDRDRVTRYPLRLAIVCIFRMFVFVARPFAYICKSSVMCVKGAEKSEFCARFQSGVFLKTQRKKRGNSALFRILVLLLL